MKLKNKILIFFAGVISSILSFLYILLYRKQNKEITEEYLLNRVVDEEIKEYEKDKEKLKYDTIKIVEEMEKMEKDEIYNKFKEKFGVVNE